MYLFLSLISSLNKYMNTYLSLPMVFPYIYSISLYHLSYIFLNLLYPLFLHSPIYISVFYHKIFLLFHSAILPVTVKTLLFNHPQMIVFFFLFHNILAHYMVDILYVQKTILQTIMLPSMFMNLALQISPLSISLLSPCTHIHTTKTCFHISSLCFFLLLIYSRFLLSLQALLALFLCKIYLLICSFI